MEIEFIYTVCIIIHMQRRQINLAHQTYYKNINEKKNFIIRTFTRLLLDAVHPIIVSLFQVN